MIRAIIVDRDGTLASVAYVAPQTRDNDAWRIYNAALPFDAPVPSVVAMVRDWKDANPDGVVIMVSGRAAGDHPRDFHRFHRMMDWIAKHDLPIDRVFMRRGGDTRLDSIVKREIYDNYIVNKFDVQFCIDDRPQVIEVWKSVGLKVVQVTDPNIIPPIAKET